MKKIYMILAAMTLLSMSLNAQLLPEFHRGGNRNSAPAGTAYLYTPGGQFRMPTLGSGEYLFGPYTTDDFDATGASLYTMYNRAQNVTVVVDMLRSEFEEHLGDSIIGFRFALAGSNPVQVYDFGMYPANDEEYSDQSTVWSLGQLMSGNTGSQTETTTGYNDITIKPSGTDVNFSRIELVYGNNNTVIPGCQWQYNSSNYALPTGWSCTSSWNSYQSSICYTSGTITIPSNLFSNYSNIKLRITAYGDYSSSSITVNGGTATTISTSSNTYSWDINETAISVTTNTVDVGRGATKYEYLPVSGYNMDYGFQNQMIYRAGQLAMANGAQITSVTFYPEQGIGIPFSGAEITVRLANVTNDNFGTGTTGTKITSGLTTVATITPVADSEVTAWKIDFTTPFTYTGGNLLVQMSCPGNGNWAHANFLGDNQSANVSLVSTGASANQSTTGNTSTFLPKATFAFTGNVNTPEYLTLQPGEWHDFFLEQPIEFTVPDGYDYLSIGYTYYQQYSSSFAPVAYNSNSTGRDHWGFGYGRSSSYDSYSQSWWGITSSLNGNLAVQLILKSQMEKTDAPTITYSSDAGTYYITATAPATDPNAVVTLTVNGTTVSGTGSVQIPIGRTDSDVTVTATATAQAEGKLVSDPTTQAIVIEASLLEPTPTPSISSQVHDLTVQVNGSGEGEVHMYIDGQEVNNPYYLERGTEDYYVTVAVTAQINDTQHAMSTTTQQVLVPMLENLDELIAGWTLLPGTYSNNSVINWNDNMMFVDRFTASTAQNDHAPKYIYKMTENDTKLDGNLRSTNEHIIPVMKTGTKILPFYNESDVTADTDREHVEPYVMNSNAEMYLEHSSDIYYYTLDRSVNSLEDDDYIELTKLQRNLNNTYTEMGSYYLYGETFDYGTRPRLDNVTGLYTGSYGSNFMSYVPIVWTLGNDPSNKRLNWDNDHIHNSYGSPIWMLGAPQVRTISLEAQMQRGPNGSTQWDGVGGPCSLYFLGVEAFGDVPSANTTNIDCEPYMFRVWIQSPGNYLRGCTLIPEDPNRPEKPGEHWEGDGTSYGAEPVLVYEGLTTDGHLFLDVEEPPMDNQPWASRIQFGAIDNIPDLQVYIRFYYKSEGEAAQVTNGYYLRGGNRDGGGYGAGEGGGAPGISTGVKGVYNDNNKPVDSVTYVNTQGMTSDKPFSGINIVITRYSDGTTRTTKVVR